jgi:hypothetical protein
LDRRGITLLPVLISDVRIPPSIERYRFYDCRQSLESKLQELADRISAIPEIDFSKLGGKEFEDLVSDLMIKLRFTNIRKRVRVKDFEFDIKADYLRKDPFGVSTSETWLTECKLYKHSRVDLKTIKQFLFLLSTLDSSCYGLLVMNNQLTSVAEEYLEKLKSEYGKEIRVIDGPELKRLLLEYTDLIQKYFSSKDPEKNEPGL